MRVAIRPCFAPGKSGGIEQYVQGLAGALGRLEGPDRFEFVGTEEQRLALARHVGGSATWVTVPSTTRRLAQRVAATPLGPAIRGVVMWTRAHRPRSSGSTAVPTSPAIVEGGGYEVVHFAAQAGERTALPNLYQPWDLQHLHYPEYFSSSELVWRDAIWGPCCARATYVVVASHFVRDDVVNAYGIDPRRVAVVAPGAPLLVPLSPRSSHEPYALYPAQRWSHKNHMRLLDALATLRARGTELKLVCTGQSNQRDRVVRDHARGRGVEDLVDFRGFVDDDQLALLYAGARCLVFPSLFEGFGFPVLEAFAAGVPVACADATSLPELTDDAAVLFDPTDVDSIADALERVWSDDELRATLAARGHDRAAAYSWDHLARSCRALYRAAAQEDLAPDDLALLSRGGSHDVNITLVTPTLNADHYLGEMLASVRAQDWDELEHIVVDGGSRDDTLGILGEHPDVRVVSGADEGLYDALNRGIAFASGDIVGFVNADDLLAPGALAAVDLAFAANPRAEMVAGGGEVFRCTPSGTETLVHVNDDGAKLLREQDVIHGSPILNARFFRRGLLQRVGPFDTRWSRCADFDFLMRVLELNPERAVVDQVVYRSRAHADSLTFRGGVEIELTQEQLALCTARLGETTQTPALHRRYRRWHSWEATYLAWRQILAGRYTEAARSLANGLAVDPLLPVVVPVQIAQHLRMRAQHR